MRKTELLSTQQAVHSSILIEETIVRFGYDPRLLKKWSKKLVVKKFQCCNLIADRGFGSASYQHMCQKCANKKRAIETIAIRSLKIKEWLKTHDHPRLGSHMSDKTKAALKAAQKPMSVETRAKLSRSNMGRPCPEKALAYWKDPKHLGINHHRYGVKPSHSFKVWYACKNGTEICFRSTWEARVARHLDENAIDWQYESSTYPVVYLWNGEQKQSTYRTDFWLPKESKFIEVKGLWREEYLLKYQALIQQHAIEIEIWDRAVLKSKGIRTGALLHDEFSIFHTCS